jgi:ribosomal-protein-alanine N-acetyltransferase
MIPELSTPALTIRTMQPADLGPVYAIEQRIFPSPWSLTSYQFEMQNPISQKWVAEVPDSQGEKLIAGMIIIWLLVDTAHIGNIGVDLPYRRQSIACRLLKTALESCSRLGALSSTLEVRESNAAALALYYRFGFEQVGRRKGYYLDTGEDALLLTLHELDAKKIGGIECKPE